MTSYDLHTHTSDSFDCRTPLSEFTDAVIARGLTGVAVTDHDTIDGALRLRDTQPPFDVIIGCEVTLNSGDHVIGLFLESPVAGGSFEDTAAAIHEQGGLVLLPHPFRSRNGALSSISDPMDIAAMLTHVDMIEVFNAKSPWQENQAAMHLARTHEKAVSAGSDAHRGARIGDGLVRVAGPRQRLSRHRLSAEPVRIMGIDQLGAEAAQTQHGRERIRHCALGFQNRIPAGVWRWGKEHWERHCDRRDKHVRAVPREYGRFEPPKRRALSDAGLEHQRT